MRLILIILLGFGGLILQSTLFSKLTLWGAKPDLLLILTIYIAFLKGVKKGAFVGIVLGLLEDLFMAKYIGLNALAKGLVGFVIGFLEKRMYKDNFIVSFVTVVLGTILYVLAFFFFANIVGYSLIFIHVKEIFLPLLVYNVILGSIIYRWIYKLSLKKGG